MDINCPTKLAALIWVRSMLMVDITHACTLLPRGLDPDMSIIIKKVRRQLPPLPQCYSYAHAWYISTINLK